MRFAEFRYWSPLHYCNVARLSMVNDKGEEYFCIVPMRGTGKQNKMEKQRALDLIADAIENSAEPGPVSLQ
jgi:hypothetical protein